MKWKEAKGISFERLRSLVDVRERGGISRAAPGNIGRQNLIGRQIRDLESYFGVKLLQKKGRSSSLTPEGLSLATTAAQIVSLVNDFRANCAGARKAFRLAAGGTLYDDLIARRAERLRKEKLALHLIEIKQPKIFDALKESRIDAAISWSAPTVSRDIAHLPLGVFEYALYGSRKLLQGVRSEVKIFELPTVLVAYRDLSTEIERRLLTDDVVVVDENVTALNVVDSGHYVGILPCLLGDQLPTSTFRKVSFPFLSAYSRKVSFFWNNKSAELRGFSPDWMREIGGMFKL